MNTSEEAAKLLREAADLVGGARADEYGDFLENAAFAATYAGVSTLEAIDVMIGFKKARLRHSPDHHDSIVDGLGYQALREVVRLFVMMPTDNIKERCTPPANVMFTGNRNE